MRVTSVGLLCLLLLRHLKVRVQGLGSGVQVLGFRVWSLGFGFRFWVSELGFRVWGSGFGVQGVGFRVWGSGFRV